MIRIKHVSTWSEDIERLAASYVHYFGATVGDKYANPKKGFEHGAWEWRTWPSLWPQSEL
jgi:hypothetical protein